MYSKKLFKQAAAAAVLALAVLFFACSNDFQPVEQGGLAAVSITVMNGRTVFPDVSLSDAASFKLLGGTGGAGETELATFSGAGATVSLEPGTWNFTLNAYDNDDNLILQGMVEDKEITLDGPNQISFYLAVLNSGAGAIQITLNFPAAAGVTRITAGGDVDTEEFPVTAGEDQFVYEKTGVEAGDYFISFRLFSGDMLKAVVSELVLVRGNVTSSKTITLVGEDLKPEQAPVEIEIPDGGAVIYISTQAALESIRDHIDDPAYNYGKNAYVLEQDITLSGTWEPIGRVESVDSNGNPTSGKHAFSGNFYGNGHTIRNLVLPGGSIYIGLFGYIENALIRDLQVELGTNVISLTSNTSQRIGIIAGTQDNSNIKNSGVYSSSVVVINGGSSHRVQVGGISSDGNNSSGIENCYVILDMTITHGGTHLVAGGISNSSRISNCYYVGNITGNGLYAELFGFAFVPDTVENSYSAGKIINNASNSIYTSTAGIAGNYTINCATLIEKIDSASNYARISHSTSAPLTNNYAYSGMLLNGATVTSSDPNSRNGLDKTAAELKQRSTYESGLGWDFTNVWEMGPSSYPFPILKWQNGVVKLPPGFTVIGDDSSGIEVPDGGTVIHISTQAELESIRDHIDDPAYNYGKNAYVLDQDITLTGTWTPIGQGSAFSGNFYGNGHTISNLVLPGGSLQYIGLFGYIEDVLIQDLQVELGTNVISVSGNSQNIGVIAGRHKNSVIRNCGVYSQSGITITGSSNYVIQFAGISTHVEADASIIENCYVSMNITITNGGTHINAAALAWGTVVKNCYYIGAITSTCEYSHLMGIQSQDTQMSYTAGKLINNAIGAGYTSAQSFGGGSIINSVTLMDQIYAAASTSYAKRIDTNPASTLANNYAYSGMLVNGATVTSSDANSQNGLDKTAAELKQRSTYESGLGWDFTNVWEMGPSSYPFPILKWQNGVVKLPQGFTVIGSTASSLSASTAAEFATALSSIQSSSNDDFIITLTADMSLAPQNLSGANYQNKRITLNGNSASRTITLSSQGSLFTVGADVELVLENIVLTGISNNNTSLVKVNTSGKLVLNSGGKVTGNTYTTSVNGTGGGGVYMDGGTLEISGGEINENSVNSSTAQIGIDGGGVLARDGSTVLMSGGTIKDNHVHSSHTSYGGSNGGGIRLHNSSFEMISGIIEGNTVHNEVTTSSFDAYAIGGGISFTCDGAASFLYIKGGIIRNNSCTTIASKMAISLGGGIAADGSIGEVVISGGIISGNNCMSSSYLSSSSPNSYLGQYLYGAYGGGVYFDGVSFIKSGGIIYGNEAVASDTDGIPLKNTAQSDSNGLGGGYAVFNKKGSASTDIRRNSTSGENHTMDSSISGSAGGWE